MFHCKFSGDCNSERIFKIGQYLTKLCVEHFGFTFFGPPCIKCVLKVATFGLDASSYRRVRHCLTASSIMRWSSSSYIHIQSSNSNVIMTSHGKVRTSLIGMTVGLGNVKIVQCRYFVEIHELQTELDLVCRKRAVSNSRPACRKAFLKFVALLVFTRDSRPMPMM